MNETIKSVSVSKFSNNDASLEFFTSLNGKVVLAVEVAEFEEEKTLEKEELKSIIDGLTKIYNSLD